MDIWMGLMAILTLATIGALMYFDDGGDKNDKDDNGSIYKHNFDSDFWKRF